MKRLQWPREDSERRGSAFEACEGRQRGLQRRGLDDFWAVQNRFLHHRRRHPALVEAELSARRLGADVVEDAVADPGHVRRLGEVVAATAGPDQHIVGKVPGDPVRPLLWGGHHPAECGNVLVVPSVAWSE